MSKKTRSYLPTTRAAASVLGSQVKRARTERGWTIAELAERVGVTQATISRVERGEPTVALGVAFEAAAITGVPLFTENQAALPALADAARLQLALLPSRVAKAPLDIDNDF